MKEYTQWEGFEGRIWKEEVNVRDFIQKNYTPYEGDESFLAGPTEATNKLWDALQKLQKEERAKGGVLDMETSVVSGLTSYGPAAPPTATSPAPSCTRSLPNIPAPTTRPSLTPTPLR